MRRIAALGVPALAALASVIVLAAGTTLAASGPTATTGAASSLTDTQASIAGTVNPQGESASYAFQYGTTTAYGQQTTLTSAGSGSADVPVSADLSGLTPGTSYHYRVIATNTSGTTVVGDDKTFATTGTAPPPAPRPAVTTGSASVVAGSATLAGSVNPNGLATSYYFELGTSANYGQQTPPQSAGSGTQPVAVSAALSGLKTNTTYHYRLVALAPGGAVALGSDATFSTAAVPTRLAFFGTTSFADQHGVGGVFLGCFGTSSCRGSVTLSRSGHTLGTRTSYTIGANDGGFVHVTLNALGQSLLRHRGTMNVTAAVANANGQKVTGKLKLVRYSTAGLRG
jgi:phosphodiesterase/alkaline phosphatase D-like protein